MPHFIASALDKITYPNSFEDIKYNFEVFGKNDSLISVSTKDASFFLMKKYISKEKTIVKPEKYTRIPQVSIIQEALIGYSLICNAKIISQNIHKKNTSTHISTMYAIKDNRFFINLFKDKKIKNKNIHIEIGFGSGRHILDQAKNKPDDIFIGLEVHYPSIEQVSRLAQENNIKNLFLHKCDARVFIELVPSNCIKTIYVHFPVPWDKKPHRRIYSKAFLKQTKRILDVNATLELRTDSKNYYEYAVDLFKNNNQKIIIKKNQDINISSKYEDRWKNLKKNIYDIVAINTDKSKKINNDFDFDFKEIKNTTNSIQRISKKYKKYFVNIQDIYKNDNIYLIKISFGSFNKAVNNYIQIKNNKYSYVLEPIRSKYNVKSHKKIIKLINKKVLYDK